MDGQRNDMIIREYTKGSTIANLARGYSVGTTRIKQVLDAAGVRRTKEPGSYGQQKPGREPIQPTATALPWWSTP